MPTALLAGAFGQGNLGDEALLDAFVTALPDWRLAATCCDVAAERHGYDLVGYDVVPAREPLAVARATLGADAVVMGGGTVLKTLHPSSHRRRLALLANTSALVAGAAALRRPVAMLGIGTGDLRGRGAPALARYIVCNTDLMVLRDEESAMALTHAGVPGPFRVGADPAWTLLDPPEAVRSASGHTASGHTVTGHTASGHTVMVVPSALAAGRDGRSGMLQRLASALARLQAAGVAVQLQAWQSSPEGAGSEDDVALVEDLVQRLGSRVHVVETPRTLRAAVESMRAASAVLSFRFHGLMAACAAGVPTVAVAHEAKLAGLARRLEQPSVAPDFDPVLLADQVCSAIGAPGPSLALIKEQIANAEEGFRLLRVLLSRGAGDDAATLGALPLVPAVR